MQQKDSEVVPRTLWEFLDKWLQRLSSGDSGSRSTVKIALIIVASFYLVLVAWRIWLVSNALTTFGVDIASVLPVAPGTAALIQKGVTVLLLFSPDALLAYVFFNRDARYWRAVTAISLVAAVGASWWATHEPAVGTHCYGMTPDRGVVFAHMDEQGRCGIDRSSGLQMSPLTQSILICTSAMQRGITPTRLATSAVNPAAMFDIRNGRSLYWFRRVSDSHFEFYDGPGFDQATATPLEPVTPQNLAHITEYINKRQAAERTARDKAAAAERAAARREQAREAKHEQRVSGRHVSSRSGLRRRNDERWSSVPKRMRKPAQYKNGRRVRNGNGQTPKRSGKPRSCAPKSNVKRASRRERRLKGGAALNASVPMLYIRRELTLRDKKRQSSALRECNSSFERDHYRPAVAKAGATPHTTVRAPTDHNRLAVAKAGVTPRTTVPGSLLTCPK